MTYSHFPHVIFHLICWFHDAFHGVEFLIVPPFSNFKNMAKSPFAEEADEIKILYESRFEFNSRTMFLRNRPPVRLICSGHICIYNRLAYTQKFIIFELIKLVVFTNAVYYW